MQLGFMGITFMIGSRNILLYLPLLITAILEVSETIVNLLRRIQPNFPTMVPKVIRVLSNVQNQKIYLLQLKSDIEVAIAFYLPIVLFLRRSHLTSIVLYWNYIRIRWFTDIRIQESFKKLDLVISQAAFQPNVPEFLKNAYITTKRIMTERTDLNAISQGGLIHFCNIF